MRLMYIRNKPHSGSPYCNIMGWQGWLLEFTKVDRILVQCDKPDDTVIGCMVKGEMEIEIEENMLEKVLSCILHVEFSYGQVWSFILEETEYKTIFCAMLDMAFNESGVTEQEFKDYVGMYRSKVADSEMPK